MTNKLLKIVLGPIAILVVALWIMVVFGWTVYRSLADKMSPINSENYRYKYE